MEGGVGENCIELIAQAHLEGVKDLEAKEGVVLPSLLDHRRRDVDTQYLRVDLGDPRGQVSRAAPDVQYTLTCPWVEELYKVGAKLPHECPA